MKSEIPGNMKSNYLPSSRENINEEGLAGDYDKIDLVELIGALWKQRWHILLIVVSVIAVGVVYCYTATPLYKITCQLRPGISSFDDKGNAIQSWTPDDVKAYFTRKENWMSVLRDPGKLELPKVSARVGKMGSIVSVSFYWSDQDEGKSLLGKLIEKLNTENVEANQQVHLSQKMVKQALDQAIRDKNHLAIERQRLNDKISRDKNKIALVKAELESFKQSAVLTKESLKKVEESAQGVRKNTRDLFKYRQKAINAKNIDKLQILLYLNTIQQNIAYLNALELRIGQLKKDVNQYNLNAHSEEMQISNLVLDIADLKTKRDKELPMKEAALEKKIETLKVKLGTFKVVDVITPPTASIKPAKPKKALVVVLAMIIGVMIAVFLAFVLEFWSRNKVRLMSVRSPEGSRKDSNS